MITYVTGGRARDSSMRFCSERVVLTGQSLRTRFFHAPSLRSLAQKAIFAEFGLKIESGGYKLNTALKIEADVARSRRLGTRASLALATGVGRTNRLYDRSLDFGAIFERRGGIARPPHVDRSGHALPSLRCVSLTCPRPAPSPPRKRPTRRSGAVLSTFLKRKVLRNAQTSSLGSGAVLGAFYNEACVR